MLARSINGNLVLVAVAFVTLPLSAQWQHVKTKRVLQGPPLGQLRLQACDRKQSLSPYWLKTRVKSMEDGLGKAEPSNRDR